MLRRVSNRTLAHNNKNFVAKNPFLSWAKLNYYRLFSVFYGLCGRCAESVMVNSSWTENHILSIWKAPYKTHRVYPPCEVKHLKEVQHVPSSDGNVYILSVGQYRPEKDHPVSVMRSRLNATREFHAKFCQTLLSFHLKSF